ncbi:MAG: oxidoreductase [Cohaesibacteraceae bacterium]
MSTDLAGKVIIITGAARGIGAAIAHHAAECGVEALILTDRDPVIHMLPCPVEAVSTELTNPDAPSLIAEAAKDRFQRIDGLVNAAGVTTRGDFSNADPAMWDQTMAINARAPFFLMSEVIADMRARGEAGAIVNIQSMNAHAGAPDLAVYAASKGALQTLTKNAANTYMADRIRVNGINLGWVATETERVLHEETFGKGKGWLAEQGAKQPLGRLVSEAEAARLATFLLSDASAPLTGQSIDLEQWIVGAPP